MARAWHGLSAFFFGLGWRGRGAGLSCDSRGGGLRYAFGLRGPSSTTIILGYLARSKCPKLPPGRPPVLRILWISDTGNPLQRSDPISSLGHLWVSRDSRWKDRLLPEAIRMICTPGARACGGPDRGAKAGIPRWRRDRRWKAGPTSGSIRPLRTPGPRAGWGRTRGGMRGFARRDAPREIPKIPPPSPARRATHPPIHRPPPPLTVGGTRTAIRCVTPPLARRDTHPPSHTHNTGGGRHRCGYGDSYTVDWVLACQPMCSLTSARLNGPLGWVRLRRCSNRGLCIVCCANASLLAHLHPYSVLLSPPAPLILLCARPTATPTVRPATVGNSGNNEDVNCNGEGCNSEDGQYPRRDRNVPPHTGAPSLCKRLGHSIVIVKTHIAAFLTCFDFSDVDGEFLSTTSTGGGRH
eukprot:gene22550-biopygen20752